LNYNFSRQSTPTTHSRGVGRGVPLEIFSIELAVAKSFSIAFGYQYCITIKQHTVHDHTFTSTANDDEIARWFIASLSHAPLQQSFDRVITKCVNKFKVFFIHFALKLLYVCILNFELEKNIMLVS